MLGWPLVGTYGRRFEIWHQLCPSITATSYPLEFGLSSASDNDLLSVLYPFALIK